MRKVEIKLLRYAIKLYAYRKVGTHYRPFSIQETHYKIKKKVTKCALRDMIIAAVTCVIKAININQAFY